MLTDSGLIPLSATYKITFMLLDFQTPELEKRPHFSGMTVSDLGVIEIMFSEDLLMQDHRDIDQRVI